MSERFMAHIVCPKCKKKGAAVWEESEDPVYQQGQWGTTLTRVSEGFRAVPTGKVVCVVCNIQAAVGEGRSS